MGNSGRILLWLVIIVMGGSVSINAKPGSFHELVDAYFEDYFKANPSQATVTGFHQYDSQQIQRTDMPGLLLQKLFEELFGITKFAALQQIDRVLVKFCGLTHGLSKT